jgi:hypothetical protein
LVYYELFIIAYFWSYSIYPKQLRGVWNISNNTARVYAATSTCSLLQQQCDEVLKHNMACAHLMPILSTFGVHDLRIAAALLCCGLHCAALLACCCSWMPNNNFREFPEAVCKLPAIEWL